MIRVTSGLVILEMGRLSNAHVSKVKGAGGTATKLVVPLEGGSLLVGTEDLVEESESSLGPDDESTEVSSGSELEKVEGSDVASLDSGNVSESSNDTVVLVVNNERTTSHSVLSSSSLSFTGSDLLGGDDLGDVGVGVHSLEGGDGGLGLGDGLDGGGDDEGNFGNVLDSVTTGEDEGGESGGGNGGDGRVSLLVQVDLDVPLSPDLRNKGNGLSGRILRNHSERRC